MKTSTRLVLLVLMLAWMLPLSHTTYAIGDLLFYAVATRSMEKSSVPRVSPDSEAVPEVVAPVLTTSMPCTAENTVAAARGDLDEKDLALLDTSCSSD